MRVVRKSKRRFAFPPTLPRRYDARVMDQRPTNRGGPLYWLGRRSSRFWIAVVAMIPVLYVASIGPACWLAERRGISIELIDRFYGPLVAATRDGPFRPNWAMRKYLAIFVRGPYKTKPEKGRRVDVAGPRTDIISQLYPLTWDDVDRETARRIDRKKPGMVL